MQCSIIGQAMNAEINLIDQSVESIDRRLEMKHRCEGAAVDGSDGKGRAQDIISHSVSDLVNSTVMRRL